MQRSCLNKQTQFLNPWKRRGCVQINQLKSTIKTYFTLITEQAMKQNTHSNV